MTIKYAIVDEFEKEIEKHNLSDGIPLVILDENGKHAVALKEGGVS